MENKLKEVTNFVAMQGLTPIDVVQYWQNQGLLSSGVVSNIQKSVSLFEAKEIVKNIIINNLQIPVNIVIETAWFREDLECDDMDIVSIVHDIEKQLKISISTKDVEDIVSVKDVYDIVEKLYKEKA
jgi:acyl carrier protein